MDLYVIRNDLLSGKTIYELPLRVTFYARVSTDKDEQLHSLSAQVQYYSEYIQKNHNWTFINGYVDEGISGTSVGKRENFLRMIADAQDGKFDFIITKEISRFSRNTLDSITYTQKLLKNGVGVFFQSDNINTLMPDAELRLTIMSSIAQDEIRKLSERTKFGFKRSIENGTVLGSNKIWGYVKNNGKLVIKEDEAEIVRTIFDLYANQRMGVRRVANQLNELGYLNMQGKPFSYSSINGILRNPKYKGFYCGGKTTKIDYRLKKFKTLPEKDWKMYKDESGEIVPAIVSEELWDKANAILDIRAASQSAEDKTSYQNRYPYSGKVICAEHKLSFYRQTYRYKSGNKEVWQCQEYTRHGRSGCSVPIVYTTELDEIIRQSLEFLALNRAETIHELVAIYTSVNDVSKLEEEVKKCKDNIDEILKRKDKLLDLSINGRINDSEFSVRNDRFNAEIEKQTERISELEEDMAKSKDAAASIDMLRDLIAEEFSFKNGFSIGVIDRLVDKIVVYPTDSKSDIKVEIYFKVLGEKERYEIHRGRRNTSICRVPSTYQVANRSIEVISPQNNRCISLAVFISV